MAKKKPNVNELVDGKLCATELMKRLGLGREVISAYKKGIILKSEHDCIKQIDEDDVPMIEELDNRGFLVFHVMNGVPQEYLGLLNMVNYLCVQKDISRSFSTIDYPDEKKRQEQIKNEINVMLKFASRGVILAHIVNKSWGITDIGSIEVRSNNGGLLRVG